MRRQYLPATRVALCLLSALLLSDGVAGAQRAGMKRPLRIAVQVLDGRNGKPMPNQRVLVFTGSSSAAARNEQDLTELTTGKNGFATLLIDPDDSPWAQPWVDRHVLCYPHPNQIAFRVSEIISTGVVTRNNCGSLSRRPVAGRLIFFARPATLMEKMRW